MLSTLLTAVISFISTNIDDILVLTLLFSQAKALRSIVAGQYLGMAVLVAVSLAGAFGAGFLPLQYVRLLGLVPILLGIRLWLHRYHQEDDRPTRFTPLAVALVTIANGGDNIGVYIPLFVGYRPWQMGVVLVVFSVMTGLWCFAARRFTRMPKVQALLKHYQSFLIPIVFLLLGLYILLGR